MMKWMLAVCAAGGLVVAAGGCGSTTPVQFCNELAVETCQRVYECTDAQAKMTQAFVAQFGASESECETKLKSDNCATASNSMPCQGATTYHADKADACISDLKAASCQTITGGSFTSGNCQAVCS